MKKSKVEKALDAVKWFVSQLHRHGLRQALRATHHRHQKRYVRRRRRAVSEDIAKQLGFVVRYGPFKGMKILSEQFWGCDHATKCLGLYELQTLERLREIAHSSDREVFVDIGGGDGYFAVGSVVGGLFARTITFELDPQGRKNIRKIAELNGIANKVQVLGEATRESIVSALEGEDIGKTVFLVDIEGGEFDVFTTDFLERLKDAEILMELHDPGQERALTWKYLDSITSHEIEVFRGAPRNPRAFRELDQLDDNDCWLLMSEGRGYAMDWVHLRPRQE